MIEINRNLTLITTYECFKKIYHCIYKYFNKNYYESKLYKNTFIEKENHRINFNL